MHKYKFRFFAVPLGLITGLYSARLYDLLGSIGEGLMVIYFFHLTLIVPSCIAIFFYIGKKLDERKNPNKFTDHSQAPLPIKLLGVFIGILVAAIASFWLQILWLKTEINPDSFFFLYSQYITIFIAGLLSIFLPIIAVKTLKTIYTKLAPQYYTSPEKLETMQGSTQLPVGLPIKSDQVTSQYENLKKEVGRSGFLSRLDVLFFSYLPFI